ncbi:MAG: hypothetical protein JOZ38_00090 [Candidatus Eremiobacteraeota bacterium]|nr:hypothetical protein [Candidatus Eremiobacteraeota bacterium]
MKPAAWRVVLIVLCALSAYIALVAIFSVSGLGGAAPWSGRVGAYTDVVPYGVKVVTIDPGGPSDVAGLRVGDVIDLRAPGLLERYRLTVRSFNGSREQLHVQRGLRHLTIVRIPRPISGVTNGSWQRMWVFAASFYFSPLLALWLASFGAVIAWRRADLRQARLMALTLALYSVPNVVYQIATPWLWPSIPLEAILLVIPSLTFAFFAALAGTFQPQGDRLGRTVRALCYALIAINIGINAAYLVGFITLAFDFQSPFFSAPYINYAYEALAVGCAVLAIARSRGAERQRAIWTLVPLGLLLLTPVIIGVLPFPVSYFSVNVSGDVGLAIQFLVPLALIYAVLNRRLIDIGFVLNRSVIFAIVSAIVIGTFIAVEWAAGTWLTGMTRTSSAIVGLCVALGLGLSMRRIHAMVDRFVDRVFFRKRHDDEAALRRFAHEAAYITDRDVLLHRALEEVREHTSAQEVSIRVQSLGGWFVSAAGGDRESLPISENDAAMVALRAWHKPLDLHQFARSALHGEYAFPMVSRGKLEGVLVCGQKPDSEPYAPDESDALLAVAHGVGTALSTMGAAGSDGFTELRAAILMLTDELRSFRGRELAP